MSDARDDKWRLTAERIEEFRREWHIPGGEDDIEPWAIDENKTVHALCDIALASIRSHARTITEPVFTDDLAKFWAQMPDGATDSMTASGAKQLAQAYLDAKDDCLRLHREKMDALFGPDGFPRPAPSTTPQKPLIAESVIKGVLVDHPSAIKLAADVLSNKDADDEARRLALALLQRNLAAFAASAIAQKPAAEDALDAKRWRKLKKCVLLPPRHERRLTVQDYRSPPLCDLDRELDAIPDAEIDSSDGGVKS